MLASLMDAPLDDPQFVYEPKYDGIRAIAEVGGRVSVQTKGTGTETRPPYVHLWSRLGNEKTHQFPEIAAALQKWGRKQKEPVVLDGEIVALDGKGEPTGFQKLQGRIHLTEGGRVSVQTKGTGTETRPPSTAFVAFDILRIGRADLRDKPLLERRTALERVFGHTGSPILRISTMVRGNGRALYQEALDRGWEGLIAKHAASQYKSGKRTPDWRKLKIVQEQEFVIGGWTEPRHTRSYFGALLLGVHENGALIYAGHTGTGFNERELARVMALLKPLETNECPFAAKPKTNERPHWVRPELVAQIKFTEWTDDGKLRHPVYLGLRDDKKPTEVRREDISRVHAVSKVRLEPDATNENSLIDQLGAIESSRRDGILTLPDGSKLNVTNLHKIFWPKQRLTKGDLLRYYVRVAPFLLPAVADRPLVMKRYPNGINGKWFYQHRVDDAPAGVRRERVRVAEARDQIVGGSLLTLLHMTQLAAISQDPWFSRVQHPEFADHAALDLDPSDDVPFSKVLDVARWIRDELDALGAVGVPKTSGASGLHVYLPLPPSTPYDAGLLLCHIIATVVAQKHSRVATIERSVKARGKRVYIDFMQNALGKTLATAYSARASEYAGVSAPLSWKEIDAGVRREDYTIETMPDRLKEVGDVWGELRRAKGIDLSRVTRYARR
jgi:bifunctional non-homologous end joining protein LigD